jgi:methyl-accepting chemotaxis protein
VFSRISRHYKIRCSSIWELQVRKNENQTHFDLSIFARLLMGYSAIALISGILGMVGFGGMSSPLKMLFAITLGALCTLALSLLTARSIREPIVTLTRAAEKFASGDFEVAIAARGNDEIGLLAQATQRAMNNIKRYAADVEKLASGDITAEITISSEHDKMGKALHLLAETLRSIICEIGTLTMAAMEGNLSTRGNSDQFQGGFREIVEGFNIILNAVIEPINEAADALQNVAAKDLTARMLAEHNGDFARIKDSVNSAVVTLDKALSLASTAAERVSTAAEQISAGNVSLSQGVSEQATSLEQVTSSLHEVALMARQTAANAKEARGLSEASLQAVRSGVDAMKYLSDAIIKMKNSSDATAKIVKTIDEIAFQTNLLALNAAVEAARAGDAGKGFAVVAEEVRNLAMRSAEAAKNTASMIEESMKNAEDEVSFDTEAMKCLENINSQVNRVSTVMMEIAAAAEQQSVDVEKLNATVTQMNQVTQQSASNAEESATAAEELKGQALNVKNMVGSFRLSYETEVEPEARREESSHPGNWKSRGLAPNIPGKLSGAETLDLHGF